MKFVSLSKIPTTVPFYGIGTKQVIIPPNTVAHLHQFGRVVFEKGIAVTPHSHADFAEVMLVESGEGLMKVDGKQFTIAQGDCITVEVGETHEIVVTKAPFALLFFGVKS